ncbi:MAG: hypothetical protein HYI21_00380 [Sediminibacterium sp. Gen4]|jgi:hypothetical protein|uniref:hypothetical protein n=1 Tax=unclassified Sediminibacterium TaxID=2635961 RepID=UPI0015B8D5C1|nr:MULTISPECIES: hypothetical protein [unclassified Sediminibacterium]MBW0161803.1 hypothetical protein [Sediminibacterium sp.]MBW0165008.1 hypothetical protein [Sediminibacterium sp.]NWK64463.1 hypothetical protein [Sediminibacterium sp. Gen4]
MQLTQEQIIEIKPLFEYLQAFRSLSVAGIQDYISDEIVVQGDDIGSYQISIKGKTEFLKYLWNAFEVVDNSKFELTADLIYYKESICLWVGYKTICPFTGGHKTVDGFIQVFTIEEGIITAIIIETIFNRSEQLNFTLNIE